MVSKKELGQLRFIASAPRPIVRKKDATAMLAIDTFQKIQKRWVWEHLTIVCKDGTAITPQDASETIAAIDHHRGPAGIVGVAIIDRQFHYLKKPLAKGPHVKARLEAVARKAEETLWEDVRESWRRMFREDGLEVVKAKNEKP